jgi:lipid-binding SYLF domain-containing protein
MKYQLGTSLAIALAFPLFAQNKESNRVETAGQVMEEISNAPDKIPQGVLDQADCVVIVPSVLKFAVGSAGSYGPGVITCRGGIGFYGPWGAPAMVALEGSSAESQLSGSATDFVLLLMSPRAADQLLEGKVKLGGAASSAAGPVGRSSSRETDVTVRTEILCYSRARGKFVGISLEGSTLRPDDGANKNLYGQDTTAKDIVFNKPFSVPDSAKNLLATLQKVSPTKKVKAEPK